MTIDPELSLGKMTWMMGRSGRTRKAPLGNFRPRLVLLPALVIVGFVTWMMLSGPSDAESDLVPARSLAMTSAQNTSWFNPEITPTQATLEAPMPTEAIMPAETAPAETAPVQTSPLDGLKISSQSWRRVGLGSNALVTFALRNGNDYAVKDIEISCSFTRRDGSHLTDRTRTIHDIVNIKSRKTFARMHVGFVNINASKAKCSLVAASMAPPAGGEAVTKR
jgi:hypothetical protein